MNVQLYIGNLFLDNGIKTCFLTNFKKLKQYYITKYKLDYFYNYNV